MTAKEKARQFINNNLKKTDPSLLWLRVNVEAIPYMALGIREYPILLFQLATPSVEKVGKEENKKALRWYLDFVQNGVFPLETGISWEEIQRTNLDTETKQLLRVIVLPLFDGMRWLDDFAKDPSIDSIHYQCWHRNSLQNFANNGDWGWGECDEETLQKLKANSNSKYLPIHTSPEIVPKVDEILDDFKKLRDMPEGAEQDAFKVKLIQKRMKVDVILLRHAINQLIAPIIGRMVL